MREMIQAVLSAEEEAKRAVEAARLEADGLLAAARKEAEQVRADGETQRRAEAEELVKVAISSAERERGEVIARAEKAFGSRIRLDGDTKEQAVQAVLNCVCGLDVEGK